jgi:hypothetical protein
MTSAVTAYDDTDLSEVPADAEVIFYYTDGRFKETSEIAAKFPHAILIGIDVAPGDDGDALDVEPGDATIADIFWWLKRQLARKVTRPVSAPVIYISADDVASMMVHMDANGFVHGKDYLIWSAHYGKGAHICGPDTCKATPVACDATQYTDAADGKSLDESMLGPTFLTAPKAAPAPTPAPVPAPVEIKLTLTSTGVATQDLILVRGRSYTVSVS